ncbi:MAG: flagellar biosynthetic protein FliR, partial [Bacillota bacterium]
SRTVPQLQVFFIGAPLKIAIGTGVILASLPLYLYLLGGLFARVGPDLAYLLKVIGGR